MNNVITLQETKDKYDILEVAQRYCELKKINATTYKAVVNPLRDENTSSLCFYTNTQKFYDFGTHESGDIFDLVSRAGNISLSDAINSFSSNSFEQSVTPIKRRAPIKTPEVITISSEQLEGEFNTFEQLNISNSKHYTELLNVIPEYLLKEAKEEDIALFMSVARYDKSNNTLVAGWYKNSIMNFEMITYKRRRLNGGKWLNRKGTHPNQTAFSRIYKDGTPVYIVEGARDALTSILLGLNFIAIPTTSYKNFEDLNSYIKPNDEVMLICEDMQGYKAMQKLSEHVTAERVDLKTFITTQTDKIDLSDFVAQCNNISEVQNAISA